MAASAWLISAAALQPPLLVLSLAIVAVRAFALGRAAFRYLERLVSHDVAFRLLATAAGALLRGTWSRWRRPGSRPSAAATCSPGWSSDVDAVQDLSLRFLQPVAVAAAAAAAVSVGLVAALLPSAALVLLGRAARRRAGRSGGDRVGRAAGRGTRLAGAGPSSPPRSWTLLRAAPDLVAFGAAAAAAGPDRGPRRRAHPHRPAVGHRDRAGGRVGRAVLRNWPCGARWSPRCRPSAPTGSTASRWPSWCWSRSRRSRPCSCCRPRCSRWPAPGAAASASWPSWTGPCRCRSRRNRRHCPPLGPGRCGCAGPPRAGRTPRADAPAADRRDRPRPRTGSAGGRGRRDRRGQDHPGRRAAALRRPHRRRLLDRPTATPAPWPATTSAGSSGSAPRTRTSSTRPSGRTCGWPDPAATTTRCATPCTAPGCSTGWTGCPTAWTPTSASAGFEHVRRRTATARPGPRPARRLPGAGAGRAHRQSRPTDRRRPDRRPAGRHEGRSVLLITHRLHGLDQVDEIVVHARRAGRGTRDAGRAPAGRRPVLPDVAGVVSAPARRCPRPAPAECSMNSWPPLVHVFFLDRAGRGVVSSVRRPRTT